MQSETLNFGRGQILRTKVLVLSFMVRLLFILIFMGGGGVEHPVGEASPAPPLDETLIVFWR